MRRFVVTHQEKWAAGIAFLQPVEREVADQVSAITSGFFLLSHRDEGGIVIYALTGKNLPEIESRGVALQMPLANHRRVITGGLQVFLYGVANSVETVVERIDAVLITVLASQDGGTARRANRIGAEASNQPHAAC